VHRADGLLGTRCMYRMYRYLVYLERVVDVRKSEYASDDVLARFSGEIRWT
jgi:hypothetical protein